MRAADFIAKWSESELRERQASQEHFIARLFALNQERAAAGR